MKILSLQIVIKQNKHVLDSIFLYVALKRFFWESSSDWNLTKASFPLVVNVTGLVCLWHTFNNSIPESSNPL